MNDRKAALKILLDIYENKAYANIALNRYFTNNQLEDIDRRFITQLVYGTVKAGDTLLWILRQYIKMPVSKVHPVIRTILRMGIYQLFYMDKVPASAACNESVKLAKKYGHVGTVKFVNAVLRSVARDRSKCDFTKAGGQTAYIALQYCHPEWLVKLFMDEFGREQTIALCQFNNTEAPLSLRCNTLKNTVEQLQEHLLKKGVECERSRFCEEAVVCTHHPSLTAMEFLKEGRALVQDESSMLVAHVINPAPTDLVIDVCSAPGGKTTHIAALMGNKGKVIANDIHAHKIKLIEENAARLGITNIEVNIEDARNIGKSYKNMADKVLADVPCSGLGVLRRKVDARWNKTEAEIEKLPQLQYEILESAAEAVKPGGILVYSTCTIIKRENSEVVNKFLAAHEEFKLEPLDDFLPSGLQGRGSMLQLLPHVDNVDGFFIARMQKMK